MGGLADKSGIRVKDKIVGIDHGNFNLNDVDRLNSYLKDKKSVTLKIEENGKIIETEINESEKNEIAGGLIPTLKDFIIVCCYDIPPSRSTGDYI